MQLQHTGIAQILASPHTHGYIRLIRNYEYSRSNMISEVLCP